jgi:hypothetical protein
MRILGFIIWIDDAWQSSNRIGFRLNLTGGSSCSGGSCGGVACSRYD